MTAASVATQFIQQREGCRLTAYPDSGGIWTVGWGSTGPDIVSGTVWTQAQAGFRLSVDVQSTANKVTNLLKRNSLSDSSIAAIVSFAYNVGTNALASSHFLACVNSGDDIGAAKALLAWDHVGQTEIKGLLIRRLDEAGLYLKGTV